MSLYYRIPISYYHLYLKKGSAEGLKFTRKKLNLYKNWKRQLVLWALGLKLLPHKRINSDADIIFMGNRKKEIYFDKKKIITYGNCKKDYETRLKMNKYFNCIRNPQYFKDRLEEDLIWPTREVDDKDVINVFERLIQYYQETLTKSPLKKIIEEREGKNKTRLVFKNRNEIFVSTKIQGDLWRGNIEKGENGQVWIFDWEHSTKAFPIGDFYNFFIVEYLYLGKINKILFKTILKNILESLNIEKNILKKMVNIETKINQRHRLDKQNKNIIKYKEYFIKNLG